ncbi:uncharacterized protein [Clytia hemisphaerica]|uniref:uncharacterized protein n=1 Tax=Clytia hemisphaerica TaxID=252671 RepID=UPI0034D6B683
MEKCKADTATATATAALEKKNTVKQQTLEGTALKSINGLELTQTNYNVAIEILKERYGNTQLIIDNHYTKLSDLGVATDRTYSLRSTFDTIEQHLRSLEALGEHIDQRQNITLIRRKFPESVIKQIEMQKPPEEPWTVENLRKTLQRYIAANELAAQHEPKTNHHQGNRRPDYRDGTMFSNTRQRTLKCIFCGKGHWNDECKTVPTVKERKEKLKGKCFICLKSHQGRCRRQKPCYHCKKTDHHRSLCPTHAKRETDNGMIADDVEIDEDTLIEEEGLLSAGENVIMQTALIEAMDREESTSETTRVLMDTGSSRTYITQELVEKLKLEIEDKKPIDCFYLWREKAKGNDFTRCHHCVEVKGWKHSPSKSQRCA